MEQPTFITHRVKSLSDLGLEGMEPILAPRKKKLLIVVGPHCSGKTSLINILAAKSESCRIIEGGADSSGATLKTEMHAHLNRTGIDMLAVDDIDSYNKVNQSMFLNSYNGSKTLCPVVITCVSLGLLNNYIQDTADSVYFIDIDKSKMLSCARAVVKSHQLNINNSHLETVIKGCSNFRCLHNQLQAMVLRQDCFSGISRFPHKSLWNAVNAKDSEMFYELVTESMEAGVLFSEILWSFSQWVINSDDVNSQLKPILLGRIHKALLLLNNSVSTASCVYSLGSFVCGA